MTKNKKWRDVSSALNIGGSSSAGFTLRKNYAKYLFAFECRFDRGNVDPLPILAQIDASSKKDSKRSSSSTSGSYELDQSFGKSLMSSVQFGFSKRAILLEGTVSGGVRQ